MTRSRKTEAKEVFRGWHSRLEGFFLCPDAEGSFFSRVSVLSVLFQQTQLTYV
jgi:hypothetical protein